MKFGLDNKQYQEVSKFLIEPLTTLGARLWCFGSRARGDHHPFSDLDIMIEASDNLDAIIAAIKERFEKSNFPFKLDLVQKKDFAQSYLAGFERDKVPLKPQSPDSRT